MELHTKNKFVLVHAMKAYERSKDITPLILNLMLGGGQWQDLLYSGNALSRRLGGLSRCEAHGEKKTSCPCQESKTGKK